VAARGSTRRYEDSEIADKPVSRTREEVGNWLRIPVGNVAVTNSGGSTAYPAVGPDFSGGPRHPVLRLYQSRELLVCFVLTIAARGYKKVLVCDLARLLRKIVRRPEVPAEKSHVPRYILLQQ